MRLDHLNIVVRDLEAAVRFFRHFGYEVGDEAELSGEWLSEVVDLQDVRARYTRLESPDSPVLIELITYHQPQSPKPHGLDQAHWTGYRHIAFRVDDIDAEVERLSAVGVQFLSPIDTYPRTGKRIIYGRGPEGILIELAEYFRKAGGV
jgi:catechol 2,3-dioxygenase-like lactoylglutathione lyase family enzyme